MRFHHAKTWSHHGVSVSAKSREHDPGNDWLKPPIQAGYIESISILYSFYNLHKILIVLSIPLPCEEIVKIVLSIVKLSLHKLMPVEFPLSNNP